MNLCFFYYFPPTVLFLLVPSSFYIPVFHRPLYTSYSLNFGCSHPFCPQGYVSNIFGGDLRFTYPCHMSQPFQSCWFISLLTSGSLQLSLLSLPLSYTILFHKLGKVFFRAPFFQKYSKFQCLLLLVAISLRSYQFL